MVIVAFLSGPVKGKPPEAHGFLSKQIVNKISSMYIFVTK